MVRTSLIIVYSLFICNSAEWNRVYRLVLQIDRAILGSHSDKAFVLVRPPSLLSRKPSKISAANLTVLNCLRVLDSIHFFLC